MRSPPGAARTGFNLALADRLGVRQRAAASRRSSSRCSECGPRWASASRDEHDRPGGPDVAILATGSGAAVRGRIPPSSAHRHARRPPYTVLGVMPAAFRAIAAGRRATSHCSPDSPAAAAASTTRSPARLERGMSIERRIGRGRVGLARVRRQRIPPRISRRDGVQLRALQDSLASPVRAAGAAADARRRRHAPADRVRQHRQPASGARRRPRPRDCGARRSRRRTSAHRPTTADRESFCSRSPAARSGRCFAYWLVPRCSRSPPSGFTNYRTRSHRRDRSDRDARRCRCSPDCSSASRPR